MLLTINFTKYVSNYRHYKVISSVTKYYNGDITIFPHSRKELQRTRRWYSDSSKEIDLVVMTRIEMMEHVVSNN